MLTARGIDGESAREAVARLSPRELEAGLTLADGASTREAAVTLFVSPRTVEAHVASVYRKLGIRSRVSLLAILVRAGYFPDMTEPGGAS